MARYLSDKAVQQPFTGLYQSQIPVVRLEEKTGKRTREKFDGRAMLDIWLQYSWTILTLSGTAVCNSLSSVIFRMYNYGGKWLNFFTKWITGFTNRLYGRLINLKNFQMPRSERPKRYTLDALHQSTISSESWGRVSEERWNRFRCSKAVCEGASAY